MEKAAVSGFERQPAGRRNRRVPWAGPFTLLWTVQAKAKDAAPTGTAPAEGATVTEIGGTHEQRLGFHSQARNALDGLDHLRKMHGGAAV
jgi:hypothetical protein